LDHGGVNSKENAETAKIPNLSYIYYFKTQSAILVYIYMYLPHMLKYPFGSFIRQNTYVESTDFPLDTRPQREAVTYPHLTLKVIYIDA
jgi:hypothetical protein